jgi:hypothetical protein
MIVVFSCSALHRLFHAWVLMSLLLCSFFLFQLVDGRRVDPRAPAWEHFRDHMCSRFSVMGFRDPQDEAKLLHYDMVLLDEEAQHLHTYLFAKGKVALVSD